MSDKILKLDQAQTLYSDLRERIDALPTDNDVVLKEEVDGAGISARTYTTKFGGQFSVTTAVTQDYIKPYARASITGRISKAHMHRVTVNGTEYILRTRLWMETQNVKVYEYLGNIGLFVEDTSGIPGGTDDVPFVIISDFNNSNSIDVLTATAGTYTIKVEQINNTQKELPKSLIWGNNYVPIETNNNGGTFNGFSIGVNELKNTRGTFAIGYWNKMTDEFSYAIGEKNTVANGYTLGERNHIQSYATAIGMSNISSNYGISIGMGTDSDGQGSVAIGTNANAKYGAVAVGFNNVESTALTIPEWQANTNYSKGDIVKYQSLPTQFIATEDHTSSSSFYTDVQNSKMAPVQAPATNDVFIVGNGLGYREASNAFKIDFKGDAFVNRDVYVNCNTDSTGGVKLVKETDYATQTTAGVIKSSNSGADGLYVEPSTGTIMISKATSAQIKAGTETRKPIVPSSQNEAVFYGLAKASGDTTQSASSNAVGTYTDAAKTSIRAMLGATSDNVIAVQDTQPTDTDTKIWLPETAETPVQVPTMEDLENYVQKTDYATSSDAGIVKINQLGGIGINQTSHALGIVPSLTEEIKTGTEFNKPIVPNFQHASTFYGLAKAAGSDMSSSENEVGTYTDEAKAAIQSMLGVSDSSDVVKKSEVDNAGISNKTYTTKFNGEFSVTTATTTGYLNPYARASVTGRISKHYMHRVTINGTEYILPTRLWYVKADSKVYEYLGNLGLFISDISGVPGGTDNVPFIIISDLNNSNSIDVLTSTAGTYTIKVEQITNTQTSLPKSLIYEDNYVPIEKVNNGGTFNGFSIGVNELSNSRGTVAIGYNNKCSQDGAQAYGFGNIASGYYSQATGISTIASGDYSHSIGSNTTASGEGSCALGYSTNASGKIAYAEGNATVASGQMSHSQGRNTIANGYAQTALGKFNIASSFIGTTWVAGTSYSIGDIVIRNNAGFQCITANSDSTWDSTKWTGIKKTTHQAVIVGNGTDDNARSNAYALDWDGTAHFGGDVYVNCASDSTSGEKLATINDIPVSDVQINSTSILNNGVANIPIADASNAGVVKVNGTQSITKLSDGTLIAATTTDAIYKAGETYTRCVLINKQHVAAFYGLAKAAGDTTQAQSDNAVGTYTPAAKTAIQTMLGVENGVSFVETISSTTPTITGEPNVRYMCGEVSSISITPPNAGTIDVVFTSGTTAALLTVPSTVKWPVWFDATTLETNTIYEILITDGIYGSVMTWAV